LLLIALKSLVQALSAIVATRNNKIAFLMTVRL